MFSPSWIVIQVRSPGDASGIRLFKNCGLVTIVSTRELEPVSILRRQCLHTFYNRFIGKLKRSVQGIRKQFAADVRHEIVLPMIANERLQTRNSGSTRCHQDKLRQCPPDVPQGLWSAHSLLAHSLRTAGRKNRCGHDMPSTTRFSRCLASISRTGSSDFDSSLGNSGTTGGGGGTTSPRTRCTTQLPRFTGLVRRPGEFCVRNTAIGSKPPRPYWLAFVHTNPFVRIAFRRPACRNAEQAPD